MTEARKRRTRPAVQLAKIEKAVRSVLEAIGEDPGREGIRETPRRVARLYQRIFSGIGQDPAKDLKLLSVKNHNGMVLVKDISFHSMCEHHLLPFFGKIHIAYSPAGNRVTGLGSLARAVEILSQRPQLQERLGNNIADTLEKALRPRGLLVIVEAQHLCMAMNDAGRSSARTIYVAARGTMLRAPEKAAAFSLLGIRSTRRGRACANPK